MVWQSVISFLCFLMASMAQNGGLTIHVKITEETGAAIGDAVVLLTDASGSSRTISAKEGEYSITGLVRGRYRVAAGSPEYEPGIKYVDLTDAASGLVNFTLKLQPQYPLAGPCPGPDCGIESIEEFVKPQDLRPELTSLVQAERDFASLSVKSGQREAFLANLSQHSIIFRKNAVLAQAWFLSNPPPPGELSWRPIFADISSIGDLGYTTGPWEFRSSAGQPVTAYGDYVTIWARFNGGWKIALDTGISHDAAKRAEELVLAPIINRVEDRQTTEQIESAKRQLFQAERGLFMSPKNYAAALAENVRLYRDGKLPMLGAAAIQAARQEAGTIIWTLPNISVSSSTDFAYAYGKAYSDSANHNYLRIWKRQPQSNWRIVLDLVD